MNLMFWKRHQETSLEAAKSMFKRSHADAMKLIEGYTNEELFTQNIFHGQAIQPSEIIA